MGGEYCRFQATGSGLCFFIDFQGSLKEKKKAPTFSFPQTLGWKTLAYIIILKRIQLTWQKATQRKAGSSVGSERGGETQQQGGVRGGKSAVPASLPSAHSWCFGFACRDCTPYVAPVSPEDAMALPSIFLSATPPWSTGQCLLCWWLRLLQAVCLPPTWVQHPASLYVLCSCVHRQTCSPCPQQVVLCGQIPEEWVRNHQEK